MQGAKTGDQREREREDQSLAIKAVATILLFCCSKEKMSDLSRADMTMRPHPE